MNSVRQSLYLKYRPQRFGDLVGQEVVARVLRNAVREHRLGHAYLFTGIRGTGKTSAARILARAINCEQPKEGEPCASCRACELVAAGRSLDVIEIDAATHRGIDEIRELRERAQFLPSELRTKVYIIDEAHMLTTEAANAFLKTLEEPPEHACFILATTEPQRLAETILSRCQRFDFRRIPSAAMATHLAAICQQEGVVAPPEVMSLVAEAGAGSLRDAESILDRLIGLDEGGLSLDSVRSALGMADPEAIGRLAQGLRAGRAADALDQLRELEAGGVDPRQLLRSLGALARDHQWQELARAAGGGRDHFWLDLMEACVRGGADLRRADDPWMALEVILLRVTSAPSPSAPKAASAGEVAPSPIAAPAPLPAVSLAQGQSAVAPSLVEEPTLEGRDASAPDAPAPSAVPAQINLPISPAPGQELERRWPEVVEWAQRHHPGPFQALVRETKGTGFRDGSLLVEVRYEWHLRQLQTPAYQALLEEACRDVLGQPVTVVLVAAGKGPVGEESASDALEPGSAGGGLAAALRLFPGSTVRRVEFHDPG